MGKVVELSDDTYHQLAELAQHQQRTLEEMVRLCLAAYAACHAPQAHPAGRSQRPARTGLSARYLESSSRCPSPSTSTEWNRP